MAERDETDEASVEARARAMGWFPEEEWDEERAERDGATKPRVFLTAAEYIEKTEGNVKILRETNRRLSTEVAGLKRGQDKSMKKLDDIGRLVESLHKQNRVIGQREYERGKADAMTARKEAIEAGDVAGVDRADEALRQLEEVKPEPVEEPEEKPKKNGEAKPAAVDDETAAWVEENATWFRGDPVLNAMMIDENAKLEKAKPGMDVRARLDAAKKRVQERFPEKFDLGPEEVEEREPDEGNPKRKGPAPVGASSRRGPDRGGKKTFSDIPDKDKADYRTQRDYMKERLGIDYTEKEFAEGYWG